MRIASFVIMLIVTGLFCQALQEQTLSEIRLVSPNGKRSITIRATDGYSGIWICNEATGKAIHLFETGQCGIGLFDNYKKSLGCTAALSTSQGIGYIQLIDENNRRVRTLDGADLGLPKGFVLNEQR